MKKQLFYTSLLAFCALTPWAAEALPGTTASLLSVYTTDNVPSLTIGYVDQFGNANGGQFTMNGTTSGATIIKPSAVASGTLTFPAATDTLVGKATTDTLTNKTLTSPTLTTPSLGVATATSINGVTIPVTTDTAALLGTAQTFTALQTFTNNDLALLGSSSGKTTFISANASATSYTLAIPASTGSMAIIGTPVACGSTCTLGAANANTYTRLDTAGGSVATLPAATGGGATYKLYISVATTSASDKVLLTTVTDTIIGTAIGENAGTAKVFVGNAGTFHSLQMPFAGSQPSGGFIGDTMICTDVANTIWKCDINYQAGTTPTTPYSASTS